MKKRIIIWILFMFLWNSLLQAQTGLNYNKNYVLTRIPLGGISSVDGLPSSSCLQTVEYLDEKGRKEETVRIGFSPSGYDMISGCEFNNFDKPSIEYTWVSVQDNSNGEFVGMYDLLEYAREFYDDYDPQSTYTYESSFLNRLYERKGPGGDWYDNDAAERFSFCSNMNDGSSYSCPYITVTLTNDTLLTFVRSNNDYESGELFVDTYSDEDGHATYTFRDKHGKTLMERRLSEGMPATYYLYDDNDHLAAVLPPMLLEQISTGNTYKSSDALFRKYAFLYLYDKRGNCIAKKLPGSEWQYIIYDAANRPILYQDGNLRTNGNWRFTLHDKSGREILTGFCSGNYNPFNNSISDNYVYGIWNGGETFLGYDIHGITLIAPSVQTANFYDSYDYRSANSLGTSYVFSAINGYGTPYTSSVQGLLTGNMSMTSTGIPLYGAYYYDDRGNVVQERTANHLGGMEVISYLYDFRKKPLKKRHEHTANGKEPCIETYTYTYDHGERLVTVTHQFTVNGNTLPQVTLSSREYDEVGRLKANKLHGLESLKQNYGYNVRSWITSISGNNLDMELQYSYSDGTPRYNGNISYMMWRSGNETNYREYDFSYDGLDRLVAADYFGESDYSTSYSYDKNGNILSLQRYGNGFIDDLAYTYNGNQLTKVEDATGNATGFTNGANQANEYAYDNNGNLTKDLNKGISNISYNSLNLPQVVTFSNGNTITYLYTADGRKLRTVHKIGTVTTTTDYCGNVIYENGSQKLLLTEEGYINLSSPTTYYYYLKDHQGNNRMVVNSSGAVQEVNHYYPFGSTFATSNVQPYKYNGKELDSKAGLNWYDYGARHYDATLGRWHVVDPLSEKMYGWSPYGYCFNNPIKHIDIDGKFPFETVWDAFNLTLGLQSLKSNLKSGNYWDATVDGLGLALDAAATVLPYIPGGVSSAIKAARGADDLVDAANQVDNAIDASRISKEGIKIEIPKEGKIARELLNPPSKPGNAPTFKSDNKPVEIHHENQNPNGPFKEMHPNEHRGKGKDKVNHPNKNLPSNINRTEFNNAKREYWKNEYKDYFNQ